MRYLCEVSYFGEAYSGWQRQNNALSVQEVIEDNLSIVLRKTISIVGSGRTDAGVHAIQQFFHFDFEELPENLLNKMNSILPPDIALLSICEIDSEVHARFTAISRSYRYQIVAQKNPFQTGRAYFLRKEVDLDKMNEAAAICIGEHDFKSFSKVKTDVKHYLCNVKSVRWEKEGPLIVFHVQANRFLRGMVRAMVGTLLLVGEGAIDVEQFREILASCDRKTAGQNVPAHGLYLSEVAYPKDILN